MTQRFAHTALVLALALSGGAIAAACGSDGDSTFNPGNGGDASSDGSGFDDGGAIAIDELTIDPTSATLSVTAGAPQTQKFTAHGRVGSGAPFDVAAKFSVDNVAPGGIDASTGIYTASGNAGGKVIVAAEYGGRRATADLTVKLTADATSGTVPPGAAAMFDPATHTVVKGTAAVPSLIYPVKETMFPQNVYRVLFDWRAGSGKLFQLDFESPLLSFKIYTDGVHATCTQAGGPAACWESAEKTWTYLAASNAGGDVTLTIRGIDTAAPTNLYESAPYVFHFSRSPVPGAIYYWSTTARGVRRGTLPDPGPTNFFTPTEADGQCVACHTVSRNGKRLAGDVGGENLWTVDVVKAPPPPRVFTGSPTPTTKIASAWATFSPDTSRIVSARGGVLSLRNGNTGAAVGGPIATGAFATMPDWAPDGQHLVYAQSPGNKDRGLKTSSIGWMRIAGDLFSNPEVVLQSTSATDNWSYPMFNPSSTFLALTHGNEDTDNDKTAQIFVAPARAASTPQQLVRADTLVNDVTTATGLQNSMATWAPTSADGLQWIAFTSTRDYATVLSPTSSFGAGHDQLWIAAIDVSKLGTGADPSFPAFRVPFVELTENAHRPFWAEDAFIAQPAVDAGAGDAGACIVQSGDCTVGVCCAGLVCQQSGDAYTCLVPIK
jgi:hypothetical protein